MTDVAPLRPAATVVVLRPAASHPFDVLLVRRSDSVAFMAGAHVFPGGRVDDTDRPDPPEACSGFDTLGRCVDLAPGEEARYRVAAIRELLEEAGLLLARRDGRLVDHDTAAAVRIALPPKSSLVAHLAARGLSLALDAVMPFDHWVTPEIEIRRFDTRFVLARMPEHQQASPDQGEMTALDWLAPGDAIDRALAGQINLPPPTWCTLKRLSTFGSIEAAWAWARVTPIVRIQPTFTRHGERATISLPGDPDYRGLPGGEPCLDVRFELSGGRWRPTRA
ncbi:MAG: NUDIX domain-containing protein [Vicinamibacterales bacterium]